MRLGQAPGTLQPQRPLGRAASPTLATPAERYQGHLPGSGVQRHSADDAYARHGIIMEAHESGTGRRLWLAKQGDRVLAAHPRHDATRFMALALVTGA